jgi:hypothetical protein
MQILSNGAVAIADADAAHGPAAAVARDGLPEHREFLMPEPKA